MRGWALVGGELSWERSSSIYRLQALSLEQHPPPPNKKKKENITGKNSHS